jgi:hypothetical protein
MDQAILVNLEIDRGAELLALLEQAQLRISVALYANLSEYGDWRLVLAARAFDELKIRQAYGLLFDSLSAAGFGLEKVPVTLILSMTDPFIKELRKKFAKAKNVEGMRLGGQLIGGRWVDDAYVYLIR